MSAAAARRSTIYGVAAATEVVSTLMQVKPLSLDFAELSICGSCAGHIDGGSNLVVICLFPPSSSSSGPPFPSSQLDIHIARRFTVVADGVSRDD